MDKLVTNNWDSEDDEQADAPAEFLMADPTTGSC